METEKQYRLIAFDMDGTLLDSRKRIRKDSLEAIHEATEKGKTVILSTGRCMPELEEYLQELFEVSYIICMSGAVIKDCGNDRNLFAKGLEREDVERILKVTEGRDLMIQVFTDRNLVEKEKLSDIGKYGMEAYRELYERAVTPVDDIREWFSDHRDTVYKMNLYSRTVEEREELWELVKTAAGEKTTLTFTEKTSLECAPFGIDKGSALLILCEQIGIDVRETIAVGDSNNDLEILARAGLSVAMGNANETVKRISDGVVAGCDEGGCAAAIREYLLKSRTKGEQKSTY